MRKLSDLLKEKKKRRLLTLALIAPFLIIIAVCGVLIFKEAKSMLSLATESNASDAKHTINGGDKHTGYLLRNEATDIQKEYFAELKDYFENTGTQGQESDVAACIVKNYVADFYTLSNKVGQYDVGGMYYVFEEQRQQIYIQARDGFYKYLSNYIEQYGAENLLEVESVEASASKRADLYEVKELNAENVEEENAYEAWDVTASWTYVTKEESTFKTSSFDTKAYFVVIDRNGHYEIVYAGTTQLGAQYE